MAEFERSADEDHETWLIEEGHLVMERLTSEGQASLSDIEKLIYALWVADYGMRNAGDLDTAAEVSPTFLGDGLQAALACQLPVSTKFFGLSAGQLEEQYFELFDPVVDEVRAAHRSAERPEIHG
jgi:hypothetical protein